MATIIRTMTVDPAALPPGLAAQALAPVDPKTVSAPTKKTRKKVVKAIAVSQPLMVTAGRFGLKVGDLVFMPFRRPIDGDCSTETIHRKPYLFPTPWRQVSFSGVTTLEIIDRPEYPGPGPKLVLADKWSKYGILAFCRSKIPEGCFTFVVKAIVPGGHAVEIAPAGGNGFSQLMRAFDCRTS